MYTARIARIFTTATNDVASDRVGARVRRIRQQDAEVRGLGPGRRLSPPEAAPSGVTKLPASLRPAVGQFRPGGIGLVDVLIALAHPRHFVRHAVALAADPGRPRDGGSTDLELPLVAHLRQIPLQLKRCRNRRNTDTRIAPLLGNFGTSGFSSAIAGSFQLVILPRNSVGQQVSGEPQPTWSDPVDVHHRHDGADHQRELTEPVAHQLHFIQRRLGNREVDDLMLDIDHPGGRAGRLEQHLSAADLGIGPATSFTMNG